jgi:hypothetical protein
MTGQAVCIVCGTPIVHDGPYLGMNRQVLKNPVLPRFCSWDCRSEHCRGGYLVGPLSLIKGIGPKSVEEILAARKAGRPLRPGLAKKLENAKTDLDSLYPVSDQIKILHPDLAAIGIRSVVTPIKEVLCGIDGAVVIIAVATRIAPRDENDLAKVKKRGRELRGPHMCLNMFMRDDSDEIFCKIDRFDYERLAHPIIERGKAGKAIYALKGTVPPDFRMIKVQRIIYLGNMD